MESSGPVTFLCYIETLEKIYKSGLDVQLFQWGKGSGQWKEGGEWSVGRRGMVIGKRGGIRKWLISRRKVVDKGERERCENEMDVVLVP